MVRLQNDSIITWKLTWCKVSKGYQSSFKQNYTSEKTPKIKIRKLLDGNILLRVFSIEELWTLFHNFLMTLESALSWNFHGLVCVTQKEG